MIKDDWYQLGIKEIFERLSTSEEGLDATEAEERIGTYGPNRLAEDEKISRIKIIIHQFKSPLIYILMIAAVITGVLREFIDMGVILAVIMLNALIGYIQEFKAEESVRALKKMLVPKARVVRNGNEKEIYSEDLVPGDVVLLTSGSLVPADVRLFKTVELNIGEAALTGESIPAEKNPHSIKEDNLTPGDQRNMAFLGTIVVSGRGKGVIVETGSRTVLGTIAENVTGVSRGRAPIQDKLERFARIIGAIVVACSVVIFFAGIVIGKSAADMFMVAVAAAVATIPEGLPIVVTIAMAIGVSRMARRSAIIRKLPAVETLGSTTVIGSDKTGTLTKNEMTVRLLFDGEHTFEVTGSGYDPTGQVMHEQMPLTARELNTVRQTLRIGMLCNESSLYEADGLHRVDGDPTEGALIVSAMKAGLDPYLEKEQYVQIAMLPFESERGYMATLHKHRGKKVIFVKGSLDKLLDLCTTCMIGEALRKKAFFEASESFARQGLRVLSMAYKEVSPDVEELTHHDVEEGLVFAGIQGMIDPPRPEAIEAIKVSKEAGIRTVMITGDYAITAVAIARNLGIGGDDPGVITGKKIEPMGDDELFHTVSEVSVYARVSPQQKLRITEQLKRHGEVVAITGDGVNDAPALKAAHIGIAMGKTGTDVAKEASDMVITDDNFASIFAAVEEGRIVFENIRKVAFFLIPTGIAAVLSIFGTMVLGLPIPYVPAQLLWINLVTNGLQDVALAFEPGEKDIIKRPPRKSDEGIMSTLLVQRTILVGAVISVGVVLNFNRALQAGDSIEQARTVAVTTMVFFQFFQAWNARSELQSVFRMSPTHNPFLFYSVIAALFAHLSVLYVPAFRWIFRTTPLAVAEWFEILAVSSVIIIIVELDKWMRRRKMSRNVMVSENT